MTVLISAALGAGVALMIPRSGLAQWLLAGSTEDRVVVRDALHLLRRGVATGELRPWQDHPGGILADPGRYQQALKAACRELDEVDYMSERARHRRGGAR